MNNKATTPFCDLDALANHFRDVLKSKKYVLLFAYNGTGKTRLSRAFKDLGREFISGSEEKSTDTLYYNAFTEDLFTWDNDLESDTERRLYLNRDSKFFNGLRELSMEERIRKFLSRYADFEFDIKYDEWFVQFSRNTINDNKNEKVDNIKISRGEENIFIWCFFLAIMELVIDQEPAYSWVKYIYIDDPISSLDDNNVIAVASHLAQLLKEQEDLKVVISSHHALFFNVMHNELKRSKGKDLLLKKNKETGQYILQDTSDTPFFNHVSLLVELSEAVKTGKLYTYHFNILRNILEKAASFHGYKEFGECIKQGDNDPDEATYTRYVNILSHGNYSLFEPREMVEDNKKAFRDIFYRYINLYRFNPDLFKEETRENDE